MTVLAVTGLEVRYRGAFVLRGASLSVAPGESAALFGANGSGKSTLLRAVSGLVAYEGDILLAGRSLRGLVPEAIASLGVAHVPQGRGTFVDFTVDQNLTLGGTPLHRHDLVARKAEIYELIPELKDRRGQIAGTMSGGEQQMLAVGRALMMRPKLLLLDEPSFGLAPRIVQRFFEMVTGMRRQTGMAILLVEQHPLLVADFVDTAHLLRNGRIVLSTRGNDPALPEVMWGQQFPTEATPT